MVFQNIQNFIASLHIHPILVVGIMVFLGIFSGKAVKLLGLPSVIGFMLTGVVLGPSLFNLLNEEFQQSIGFLTDVALSFVALSIGLELSFSSLKRQGGGIVITIFTESFFAFGLVALLIYLVTRDLALAILFGAIAPASAPAGTVAIIQEYSARGPLTRAMYSVVGFDDGLGIIIFGFAAAFAKFMLASEIGMESQGFVALIAEPLIEVGLSIGVGAVAAFLFVLLSRKLDSGRDLFLLLFAFVFISAGLSVMLHLSVILTNMVLGIVIINTQKRSVSEKINVELTNIMPLLFVLFFVLAGSNLHIGAIPSLGLTGLVYVVGRIVGLVSGATLGAKLGRLPVVIQKYLGLGILSQAGVAIGLALIIKKDFLQYGARGERIGNLIITTVTATSIFFELIGPLLAKIALRKAGEIQSTGK